MFAADLSPNAIRIEGIAGRNTYDLATALRIVRKMETSSGRAAVYEEIKKKNALYRLVDFAYTLAGKRAFQPFLLWIYMFKCILSVGPFRGGDGEAVALSNFPNEEHTIERIVSLVPDAKVLRLSIWRRHAFGIGQLRALVGMICACSRVLPFLGSLTRSYSFMPAARIASALAFYMRFTRLFHDQPRLKAAIIASNYSPEAVGLAAAAHRFGRKVVYSNHAPVPANGPVVPPVYADLAIFYGEETLQTYTRRSACTADVAFFGQPGGSQMIEWRNELRKVGIFLTCGTRVSTVSRLILAIRSSHPDVQVLVRDHPVTLLRNDLSEFVVDDTNVELTIGNPLEEEIAACDMVICGNSGVALNVLRAGRPVAYLADLDGILFDSNGFIQNGLVLHVPDWTGDTYARLKAFYDAPTWLAIMQFYDASYCADVALLEEAAARKLRHFIT